MNSNVVHTCERTEDVQQALVHTQWFEWSLITRVGMRGNRYVSPIEACISMEGVVFRHDMEEHAEMLDNISDAYSAAQKHENGYELSVCANLNLAWKQLYKMVEGMLSEKTIRNCSGAQRLRVMLAYMHRNYDKAIGIKEINWATGVYERECFRLFDKYFKLSPEKIKEPPRPPARLEDYEAMSKEELIQELVRAKIVEARLKKRIRSEGSWCSEGVCSFGVSMNIRP